MKKLLYILFFVGWASIGYSQTTKPSGQRENSFEPFEPNTSTVEKRQVKRAKKSRKSKKSFRFLWNKRMDNKVDEFWERMEANAKRDRKIARKMQKPQYSDPMYFGHKRKPKKRPRGKRKFCKECGITH